MSDAAVAEIRHTPEYRRLRAAYADRNWRLDNLYRIKNKEGEVVPYRMKPPQRDLFEGAWNRNVIPKARQIGFCLAPEMRVLTDDLRWIAVGDLQPGTGIIGVDEDIPGGRGAARKMRRAIVEAKWDVFEDAYRLTMSNGVVLVATGQHRFLCRRRAGPENRWRSVSDMRVGDQIRAATDPWGDRDYEDGWMAGMLDGEGHLAKSSRTGASVTISQVDGDVLRRLISYCVKRGYNYRVERDLRVPGASSKLGSKIVYKVVISRLNEVFRLLGHLQPSRFAGRDFWLDKDLPGKRTGVGFGDIVAIEALGKRRMIDIQTSTKTFICEGYVSHNSTHIGIEMLDTCIFRKNTIGGIVDAGLEDAKLKLQKIRFAYEGMPVSIRQEVQLVKGNAEELAWSNGSAISVGTSYRGGTAQLLHVSEFGPISADRPEAAKEIVTGSFGAVPKTGRIWVESTAKGTAGEFKKIVDRAEKLMLSDAPLTPLDFKLHFYPWHLEQEYRLPAHTVILSQELREYFEELAEKYGIRVDGDQCAWYAKQFEALGPDETWREYPSFLAECFLSSLKGAYFKEEMTRARREKRIGQEVPHDPSRPVQTFWDIGAANTVIIFHQGDGVRNRFIDFWEGDNGLAAAFRVLQDRALNRGFRYGKHYGPHDLDTREWGAEPGAQPGRTRKDMAADHGIDFTVVPRVAQKADSIESARRMINNSWFCERHAKRLVEHLDNYSKRWSKAIGAYIDEPMKNGHDHASDALQQGAMGLDPDELAFRVARKLRPSGGSRKGSHWSN